MSHRNAKPIMSCQEGAESFLGYAWTFPKMPWSVKISWTHLKSWRDRRMCKSKRPALIQVHSCWRPFVKIPFLNCTQKRYIFSCFFFPFRILSPHFLPFRKSLLKISSKTNRAYLMAMKLSHSYTMENQNLPIDRHCFILEHFLFCFSGNFFLANFPNNWNFLLLWKW